jgi:hypothetical protein
MTIRQAEKKYNIEIVDRTHIKDKDMRNYWLNMQCEVKAEFPDFYELKYWDKAGRETVIDVEKTF